MRSRKDVRHALWGPLAKSDLQKGTHHRSHHVAQKAIGTDVERPLMFSDLFPMGFADVTNGGSLPRAGLAKRSEIPLLDQMGSRGLHRFEVELPKNPRAFSF